MILVFSGTGNTLAAARMLATELGQKVLVLREPELSHPSVLETRPDEPVIWAFPVYAWGVPAVVADYIRKCRPGESAGRTVHHALISYGDDAALTGAQFRTLIEARGLNAGDVYGVALPNTYVCLPGFDIDPAELARRKSELAAETIKDIADKIRGYKGDSRGDYYRRGSFAWFKSRVIRPWFNRHLTSPERFTVSEACTACGACVRACPMANISILNDKASVGTHCAFCLGCYHICPQHAINYGKSTLRKGQKSPLTILTSKR